MTSRVMTSRLLECLDEGLIDHDTLIGACLSFMSEDDVREMIRLNDGFDLPELSEDDEDDWNDGQPDEAQEWHDFDPDC